MDKWEGLVAVVTGASSGIGKAIAVKLAEHGMKVAALARREDKLQELSDSFDGKGIIKPFKCDITDDDSISEAFTQVENELGPIRVLVNNAGVAPFTPFMDFELSKWRHMFNVNVFGMFSCIKRFLGSIKEDNEELHHIVNMNSMVGHEMYQDEGVTAYAVSKHCVTLMTTALNKQIAKKHLNVRVSSISPGLVETEIFDVCGWSTADHPIDFTEWPSLQPEDIANATVAVLSVPTGVLIHELSIKPKGQEF